MEPLIVVPHDCPTPVVEALSGSLAAAGAGGVVAANGGAPPPEAVHLVYCSNDERWDQLRELASGDEAVVAMITELDIDQYARALAVGADGVVHFDTPAATMVSVMHAALRGEVVLPAFAGQSLAAAWRAQPVPSTLSDYEIGLLEALSEGRPIHDMATSSFYSDRTIRRHLQSVYLKLGAHNRGDALAIASRSNLI